MASLGHNESINPALPVPYKWLKSVCPATTVNQSENNSDNMGESLDIMIILQEEIRLSLHIFHWDKAHYLPQPLC